MVCVYLMYIDGTKVRLEEGRGFERTKQKRGLRSRVVVIYIVCMRGTLHTLLRVTGSLQMDSREARGINVIIRSGCTWM